MRHENSSILELDGKEVSEFTPSKPREKWLRKRTHVKIRVGVRHRTVSRDCLDSLPVDSQSLVFMLSSILAHVALTISTERDCKPSCE